MRHPKSSQKGKVLDPCWTLERGVNPLDGTNYLDTASAFLKAFLHLLAGEGVWGRGRRRPLPQRSCRFSLLVLIVVLKKLYRCASRIDRTCNLSLLLEFFRRPIAQCRMQTQPIVILLDELFDVHPQMIQVIVLVSVDFLLLQRFHEALTTRVVIRIGRSTHARNHAVPV